MTEAGAGHLPAHLVRFARVLRDAGLPAGPATVVDAARALQVVDVTRPDEFYWALHAVFVHRREQREVFHLAFRRFWREERTPPPGMAEMMAAFRLREAERRPPAGARRVSDAMSGLGPRQDIQEAERGPAGAAWSARERLRHRDFAHMSAEELAEARAVIARMRFARATLPTRRFRPDPRGDRADLRASLRAGLRSGGAHLPLRWRSRASRPPPLVVLCDISGSMEPYSRMLLGFLHALSRDRRGLEVFVFGTRLTNVTRSLRERDVDVALARVGRDVDDWSGGTRIGEALRVFNRKWSRRVLGRRATVLLITDGLDRDAGTGLAVEMARLRRSCRRLLWLNPLLSFDGFEPRAAGVRAMLPHVDAFLPVHDLDSLEAVGRALERLDATGRRGPSGARPSAPAAPPP